MISEVVMPQMGADMTEGTIVRWLKNEGDEVARGEVIAEIETDKANVEIEAFESGVFRKTLAGEGDVVQVGEVIAIVGAAEDDISQYPDGAKPEAAPVAAKQPAGKGKSAAGGKSQAALEAEEASPKQEHQVAATPEAGAPPEEKAAATRASANGRVRASPLARRIAQERGVDLRQVRGSGPDGRIVRRDVESADVGAQRAAPEPPRPSAEPVGAPQAAPAPPGPVTMSRMRQAIARRMSQSKREAPHYYLLVDIDMTDALALRKQVNETLPEEQHVTVNDLIVKACAIALQRHPQFNTTVTGETFTRIEAQNVCVAIALEDGLIAPAILDAGRKTLVEIGRETKDLVARARGGSLRPDEITAGTFSITNLGAYGIETLIGIIQPPQTAILGVGAATAQPAVLDGAVVVRQVMKAALSADHRVTDGAQGARFLGEIKSLLEKPVLLVL